MGKWWEGEGGRRARGRGGGGGGGGRERHDRSEGTAPTKAKQLFAV